MSRSFVLALICLLPAAGFAREGGQPERVLDALAVPGGIGAAMVAMGLKPVAAAAAPGLSPFPEARQGVLESSDLQIALTQLAIHEGGNNQLRLLRAQGTRRDALILRGGTSTLAELAQAAQTLGLDGLTVEDGVYHLTRPLVIWQGAGLRLQPGDRLQMSADSGAFLLSFGPVQMREADVTAVGFAPGADAYRPFVVVSGQGSLQALDTVFTGLGMTGTKPFEGLTLSQQGLFPPDFAPLLTGNRFTDLGGISVGGAVDAVVVNNDFEAARGTAVTFRDTRGGLVADNRISAAQGGAGLYLATVAGLRISGNLIRGGAGNGITLDGSSGDVDLSGNAVFDNAGSGLALNRAACLIVAGNGIAGNAASGLRLSRIGAARITGNALVLNAQAGLSLREQTATDRIEIEANLIARNRVGLTGGAIGAVLLSQNDLTDQLPRLFDGAFAPHQAPYLTAAQQDDARQFRIAAPAGDAPFPVLCVPE